MKKGGQITLSALVIGNPFQSGVFQSVEGWRTAKGLDLIDHSNYGQVAALQ
jgi:hypothetical protein